MPIKVSVADGHGAPLRQWRTLPPGHAATQSLVTGRSYRYCFAQRPGGGYRGAGGCGSLVMHSFLNGARVPDGAPIAVTVAFSRR